MPEYYLTEAEYQIFQDNKEKFRYLLSDEPFNLVELGAGDGYKTNLLLEHFIQHGLKFRYVPVDISESSMVALTDSVCTRFPGINVEGIVAEYFDALKWLGRITSQKTVVLFLGSNLGNFSRTKSRVFLRSLWQVLRNGDMVIIGFDLKKDIELMLSAYNDSKGVTAAFNLNLLSRINRELGGDFDIRQFRFYSTYNVFSGAIESYLVSLCPQEVYIKEIGQTFTFQAWEPIHTEYSYKFLESDIQRLAADTGFTIKEQYYDRKRYFVNSVWQVEKAATNYRKRKKQDK